MLQTLSTAVIDLLRYKNISLAVNNIYEGIKKNDKQDLGYNETE